MKISIQGLVLAVASVALSACGQVATDASRYEFATSLASLSHGRCSPNGMSQTSIEGVVTHDALDGCQHQRVAAPSAACQALFAEIDSAWDAWIHSAELERLQHSPDASRVAQLDHEMRALHCDPDDTRTECTAIFQELDVLFAKLNGSDDYEALMRRPEMCKVRSNIAKGLQELCYDSSNSA